jgi:hypothetical protein
MIRRRNLVLAIFGSDFYEASVANEVDRRRCRGRGDSTEDDTVVANMATYAITLCKKVALVTGVDRLW